jgi:hypothetical protein
MQAISTCVAKLPQQTHDQDSKLKWAHRFSRSASGGGDRNDKSIGKFFGRPRRNLGLIALRYVFYVCIAQNPKIAYRSFQQRQPGEFHTFESLAARLAR